MTPQQLMDLPSAGMAEKQLRNAGLWQEENAIDGTKQVKVKIKMSGYYDPEIEYETLEVIATTKDEALDIAYELCAFDVVEDHEILEVTECN